MGDNRFFWATVAAGGTFLLAVFGLALKSFYPAYQTLLQFCGVSVATCRDLLAALNPVSVIGVALAVWLATVVVFQVGRTLFSVRRLTKKELKGPRYLEEVAAGLGLAGRIKEVPGNVLFCSGILSPKIIVGRSVTRSLSRRELRAALWHEAYHLKARDPLKVLIVNSISRTLFFLPVISALAQSYLTEKEAAADRFSAERAGQTYLLSALYKMVTSGGLESGALVGFTGVRRERVSLLPTLPWTIVAVAVLVLLASGFTHQAVAAKCL